MTQTVKIFLFLKKSYEDRAFSFLAIITKHSILDVAATLDPPLICSNPRADKNK